MLYFFYSEDMMVEMLGLVEFEKSAIFATVSLNASSLAGACRV